MSSHELARRLLELPDLPVATWANNHMYASLGDRMSHGPLKLGVLDHYSGRHLVIGNFHEVRKRKETDNWAVTKEFK